MQASAASWIDETRGALDAARADLRAPLAFALVKLLVAAGRDEEAERVASEMRRESLRSGGGRGWTEAALACIALAIDNDEGVHAHVSAARAAVALEQGGGATSVRPWIEAIAFAHTRRLGGDAFEEISQAIESARESDVFSKNKAYFDATLELERAYVELAQGAEDGARATIPRAIGVLEQGGVIREAGRAMIAWASELALRGEQESTSWLARAQTLLGKSATWRDRIQLHRGFVARGRRIVDRAMNDPAAARVEAFERARGAAISAIANAVDLVDASLATATVESETAAASSIGQAVERARHAALAVRGTSTPAFVGLDRV
ncbi:MAG: hypothetical protein ACRELY_26005, partial [Polyangiaceae bacterium]